METVGTPGVFILEWSDPGFGHLGFRALGFGLWV